MHFAFCLLQSLRAAGGFGKSPCGIACTAAEGNNECFTASVFLFTAFFVLLKRCSRKHPKGRDQILTRRFRHFHIGQIAAFRKGAVPYILQGIRQDDPAKAA